MISMEQSILIGPELVKKLPAFYGTRRFITPFTIARHQPLSRARSIQFTCPIQHLKIHFNCILPYTPKYNLPNTIRVIIPGRKSVWKPATTGQMICPYSI
jgi:hypothetical protein